MRSAEGIIPQCNRFMNKLIMIVTGINRNINLKGTPRYGKNYTNASFTRRMGELKASIFRNEDNTYDVMLGDIEINFQDWEQCSRNLRPFVVSSLATLGYLSYDALIKE